MSVISLSEGCRNLRDDNDDDNDDDDDDDDDVYLSVLRMTSPIYNTVT
jgi:hypothetical protein